MKTSRQVPLIFSLILPVQYGMKGLYQQSGCETRRGKLSESVDTQWHFLSMGMRFNLLCKEQRNSGKASADDKGQLPVQQP